MLLIDACWLYIPLAGCIVALTIALRQNWLALRSLSWPEVPARLIEAKIVHDDDEGRSHGLEVKYEYVTPQGRFVGELTHVLHIGLPRRVYHERLRARILKLADSPHGLTARYNPARHHFAVLFPGMNPGSITALVMSALMTATFLTVFLLKHNGVISPEGR